MTEVPNADEPRPADEAEAAGPAPRPTSTQPRGWMAVALALFVATVGLAALSASLGSALERERDQRRDVQRVAGRFANALLTYDYKDLDAAKQQVLSLSTGKFRSEYEQAFASLQAILTQTEARAQAAVTELFLSSIDEGRAKVIVVADAASETKSGRRRTIASYIQLDLVRVEGRWLVDGVTNLNFGRQESEPPGGAPPSTAPATTKTTR